MNAFDVYKTFLGIKTHFTRDSYNFTKYGQVKAKFDTFNTRNDKLYYQRIAKQYSDEDIVSLFVSNLYENPESWVGDMLNEGAHEIYISWKKRNESLEYNFKNECEYICNYILDKNISFDNFLTSIDGQPPEIYKLLRNKKISPETYCIIDSVLNFSKNADSLLCDNPLWQEISKKMRKYKELIITNELSKKKYKKILIDAVKNASLV